MQRPLPLVGEGWGEGLPRLMHRLDGEALHHLGRAGTQADVASAVLGLLAAAVLLVTALVRCPTPTSISPES